jgi:phage baseplate assembly protein W
MKAISLPFSFNSTGAISYSEDPQKIWQDRVVLTVMTLFGERVMRPGFGSLAKFGGFENTQDAVVLIKQAISIAFSKWLPDLSFVDAIAVSNTTDNYLELTIRYTFGLDPRVYEVNVQTSVLSRSGDLLLEVPNGR